MVFFVPLVEVRLLTGLWASTLINLRWWDTDWQDGVFQGGNGGYPERLVPGGGVEPPWAEARGILSPVRLPVSPPRREAKIESECVFSTTFERECRGSM